MASRKGRRGTAERLVGRWVVRDYQLLCSHAKQGTLEPSNGYLRNVCLTVMILGQDGTVGLGELGLVRLRHRTA